MNSPSPAAIAKPVASSQAGRAAAGHIRTTDLADCARLPNSHTHQESAPEMPMGERERFIWDVIKYGHFGPKKGLR